MVTLDIDEQTLAAWRRHAHAAGVSVERWLQSQTVEGAAARSDVDIPLTDPEWHRRLHALASRHAPTGVPMDDRRETIYE